ncbi:nucleotidyltransferase [bacterium]|nr:nucleotidyltransferase [bacterium]
MDFKNILGDLIVAFEKENVDFALIGGLAMETVGIVRSTQDVDLLILAEKVLMIKTTMHQKGYSLLHESEDVLNFVGAHSQSGRVDFLLAHRRYTLAMLKRAIKYPVFDGEFTIKALRPEDLIGLKVQASSNDPGRWFQDMADVQMILEKHRSKMDMDLVKEYFELFGRTGELNEILERIHHA